MPVNARTQTLASDAYQIIIDIEKGENDNPTGSLMNKGAGPKVQFIRMLQMFMSRLQR